MKKRLCIGTVNESPALISILECIGIEFEKADFTQDLITSYSAIILEDGIRAAAESKKMIHQYLIDGGAVLEFGLQPVFSNTQKRNRKFKRSLINSSGDSIFENIPSLDVYSLCSLSGKDSGFFEGLITFEKKSAGFLASIGMYLDATWNNDQFTRKRFFGFGKPPLDEIVSQPDRHSLVEIIKKSLKHLHYEQNLPFVRKWTSPSKKPVFCFRIDSDYGTKESLDEIHDIATDYDLALTWFLHVQAHENWLDHFEEYQNQEIALHGYAHKPYRKESEIIADISKGNQLLSNAGFEAKGFCAPYGIWNVSLGKALQSFSFNYTSEFTLAYEGCPVSIGANPIQVPVHPVCTGSMSRKGYSTKDMSSYFEAVITNKLSLFEPVLLYHHPLQPGLKAIEYIFKRAVDEKFENLTFNQFANFWSKRKNIAFQATFKEDILEIESSADHNQLFEVSNSFEGFDLIEASVFKTGKNHTFKYQKPSLPSFDEIKALKKRSFQLLKTSMLDWLNRNRL